MNQFDQWGEQETEANRLLAPEQKAIGYADHAVMVDDMAHGVSFFYVMTREERAILVQDYMTEVTKFDDFFTEEEMEWLKTQPVPEQQSLLLKKLDELDERNFLTGLAFNKEHPNGVPETSHKINFWPVPKEFFHMHRLNEWDFIPHPHWDELIGDMNSAILKDDEK